MSILHSFVLESLMYKSAIDLLKKLDIYLIFMDLYSILTEATIIYK